MDKSVKENSGNCPVSNWYTDWAMESSKRTRRCKIFACMRSFMYSTPIVSYTAPRFELFNLMLTSGVRLLMHSKFEITNTLYIYLIMLLYYVTVCPMDYCWRCSNLTFMYCRCSYQKICWLHLLLNLVWEIYHSHP